jgi:hypothetical protein
MKVTGTGESRAHNGIARQYTERNGYTFHILGAALHLSRAGLSLLTTVYSLSYASTCIIRVKGIMASGDTGAYVSLCWLCLELRNAHAPRWRYRKG